MVGMMLAHIGVGVFIVGVTMVRSYEVERDVKMEVGDTVEVYGYTFTFRGARDFTGPNYQGVRGFVEVSQGGKVVAQMNPEKRVYRVQQNPMTEAAIETHLTRDLYVSLGEPVGNSAWIVRVYVKPFIDWVWGGCVLMALGGLLAVADRRYRVKVPRTQREDAALGASA
jgi:cytochrome c-type biogenesis protein CcmF